MNIFEGARRITHVAAGVTIIGWLINAINFPDKAANSIVTGILAAVAIYAFSLVMGWIVRGFAGIPGGSDHRPNRDGATARQDADSE